MVLCAVGGVLSVCEEMDCGVVGSWPALCVVCWVLCVVLARLWGYGVGRRVRCVLFVLGRGLNLTKI